MLKRFIFFSLVFWHSAVNSQVMIHGKVVDAVSCQPLEAASVIEGDQGKDKTLSDRFGNFSIKTSSDKPNLTVSYVGYKTVTIQVQSLTGIRIELQPDLLNLKDVAVQANRSASFSGLSKIDLDLKPVCNTQELLRIVPGLFIAQHAGGGKAEQIFLRGFDCDHGTDVLISVDGMPVNLVSHAHGQGYADAHFIIPEIINQVDFGGGPYYVQQGNLNTAGYVSFSTFQNIDKSRIQVEAGRFNTYRALGLFDLLKSNKDRQSAYLASEYYFTNGPALDKEKLNRLNVFGKYNWTLLPQTQLTASLSSFTSVWNASGQVPERAVASGEIDRFGSIDPSEGGNTERQNINLLLSHRFANGGLLENQLYYNHYKFNLYSNFSFYLKDTINGDAINQAEHRNMFGYQSKFTRRKSFAKGYAQTSFGTGIRYDYIKDSKLTHVLKRKFLNSIQWGDINELNSFAYAEQQLQAGKWLLNGGARIDFLYFNYSDKISAQQTVPQNKGIISPKLNIQYTACKQWQFYLKTGKGFHSNDTRVVIAQQGREILPATFGGDLGMILKPHANSYINVAAWYLYCNQEFVYVGDEGNIEPSGQSARKGIDVILRYQFSPTLFANMNLNFTKARSIGEPKGADNIPLAPKLESTGGLFYKQQHGFNGSLTYRYIKNRPANEDNSIVAKGFFLMDGAFNYTNPRYEVGVAIENIFDVDWNEAQFATESKLKNEPTAVTELNFTPGTPLFARVKLALFF